jgi:hypothetical protein
VLIALQCGARIPSAAVTAGLTADPGVMCDLARFGQLKHVHPRRIEAPVAGCELREAISAVTYRTSARG